MAKPMRRLFSCGVLLFILSAHHTSGARSQAKSPDESPAAQTEAQWPEKVPGGIRKEFRWEDINSLESVKARSPRTSDGRKLLYRPFTLTIWISPQALRKAVDSFGCPESWLQHKFRNQEELRRKRADLAAKAAGRGMSYIWDSDRLEVDYRWMIRQSTADVANAADGLQEAAKRARYGDRRKVLGLHASFVQSFPHKSQPLTRCAADGTSVYVGGVTMPLETLANGFGDCDTKCVLFGSLLAHVDGAKMVLIRSGRHAFAGILGVPKPLERFVRLRNDTYVLVELTSPWPVGHIPGENWRALHSKKFEIIPLVGF